MTKTKTIIVALIFFITGIASTYFYFDMYEKHKHSDECTASIVVFYKDIRANITLDFMYNQVKQNGVISIGGSYAQNNRFQGTIRRDVYYVWNENKDTYNFISSRINKFEHVETLSDEIISTVLPDFYVYPDNRINYSIQTQGDDGFLFIIGKRPLFFCVR